MKFVIVCLVLAVVGLHAHTVDLPAAQKEKAKEYSMECIKQSGVKPEVIVEAKKGHISDDEAFKKFILCFFQKSGIVDSEGKLNIDVALAKLPPGVDKAEASKLLEQCKNKKGKSPEDSAFETFKCYSSGTKTHIAF